MAIDIDLAQAYNTTSRPTLVGGSGTQLLEPPIITVSPKGEESIMVESAELRLDRRPLLYLVPSGTARKFFRQHRREFILMNVFREHGGYAFEGLRTTDGRPVIVREKNE